MLYRKQFRFPQIVPLLGIVAVATTGCRRQPDRDALPVISPVERASGVGCSGRILPEGGTFFVFPYTAGGSVPVVASILIKPGDELAAGEPIATLSSQPSLEAAVRGTQMQLALARARLARIKAAATPDEAAAANEDVARLQIQRDADARSYERNKALYEHDFLSKAQIETLETNLRISEALLAQARERLHGIVVARPVDIAVAESEIRAYQADVSRAQGDASSSIVRSPSKARALRVIAHAGEKVGAEGIAELADTTKMEVVAEVYEADIRRVHLGQRAIVRSETLPKPLNATITWIGLQVENQAPLGDQRGAPSDARIFKVRLKVPDQDLLADRINGQVTVVIEP